MLVILWSQHLANTNTIFLENDYMMNRKPKDSFNLKELFDTPTKPLEWNSNPVENVLETITSTLLDTRTPGRSGRIVRVLHRFMFLGEVVSDEHNLHPTKYNEAIFENDSWNWQSVMKVKIESMYSNHIWELL